MSQTVLYPSNWTVGELARKAGISIKTLHHYDQRGLLAPANYTDSGYRLYDQSSLLQLQQILTFKALGLSLDDIHRVLANPGFELKDCLSQQKHALQMRIAELSQAIESIQEIESQLSVRTIPETDLLLKVIEIIQMKQSQAWMQQFYSPEQMQSFAQRREQDPEEAARGTQAWVELFDDIRRYLDQDPASAEVQALLPHWQSRWQALIDSFTGGNPGIANGLNQVYTNIEQAPAPFKQWFESWADIRQFMEQAKAVTGKQTS